MPNYSLIFTKNAARDIAKLDPALKKRIKNKLVFYIGHDDPLAFAKTLAGDKYGAYRWRVGDYRVVFDVEETKIVVLQVQHRRDIYRK